MTVMIKSMKMPLAGETEAGAAEVQPARDNQLKATNGRWGGSYTPAIPFSELDNSEHCYAFNNLIRQPRQRRVHYLPKAEKVS